MVSRTFIVKGITKVSVPSPEHDYVPYYELLLEDENGCKHLKKSFKSYSIGERIEDSGGEIRGSESTRDIVIGVIGTGTMGMQLAQFFAQAGYIVILCGRSEPSLENLMGKIEKNLLKTNNSAEARDILDRIKPALDLSVLLDSNFIIEAIGENAYDKKRLLAELNLFCSKNAIISTNTSSISITELASSVSNPGRFIGMHFFNPISKMNLVEIVYGANTSKRTIEYMMKLARDLGKTPILVHDSPGFIVNRLLMPLINEAASLLEEGFLPDDIDNAIKLGLNHPMGPLALADLIGLDICASIMNTIYLKFGEDKYKPNQIIYNKIYSGHLGKKTGRGFYNYGQKMGARDAQGEAQYLGQCQG